MPTSRRATTKSANKPEFRQTLGATLQRPTPAVIPTHSRRGLIIAGSIAGVSIIAGILCGLALRSYLATELIVTPGSVAVVDSPQYARIAQAKALATSGQQSIQLTQTATSVQLAFPATPLQGISDINRLQPGLSAYDAQGSVGVSAR